MGTGHGISDHFVNLLSSKTLGNRFPVPVTHSITPRAIDDKQPRRFWIHFTVSQYISSVETYIRAFL